MDFNTGDIITFRLRGDQFGAARIVHIENLSQFDHYHLAILDAVLEAGDGGFNEYGEELPRSHDNLENLDSAPVVIDHLAVTLSGFLESGPMVVAHGEVTEEDLTGYHTWVLMMRHDAERRGVMGRRRNDDDLPANESEARPDDEDGIQEESLEESADEIDEADEADEAGEGTTEAPVEPDLRQIPVRPWHMGINDISVGNAVFQYYGTLIQEDEYRNTELLKFMASYYDPVANAGRIGELVARFVGGDYSASVGLMDYGDVAAAALGLQLADPAPEVAADILQMLGDMGGERAYQIIAGFFAKHQDLRNDPLAITAANGYCFAVMVTGGTPEALKEHLDKLDALLDYPDEIPDARNAVESVQKDAEREVDVPEDQQPVVNVPNNSPFGNL